MRIIIHNHKTFHDFRLGVLFFLIHGYSFYSAFTLQNLVFIISIIISALELGVPAKSDKEQN